MECKQRLLKIVLLNQFQPLEIIRRYCEMYIQMVVKQKSHEALHQHKDEINTMWKKYHSICVNI